MFNLVNGNSITYDLLGCATIEEFLNLHFGKPDYILYIPEKLTGMVIPKDRVLTLTYELEDAES